MSLSQTRPPSHQPSYDFLHQPSSVPAMNHHMYQFQPNLSSQQQSQSIGSLGIPCQPFRSCGSIPPGFSALATETSPAQFTLPQDHASPMIGINDDMGNDRASVQQSMSGRVPITTESQQPNNLAPGSAYPNIPVYNPFEPLQSLGHGGTPI